MGWCDLIRNGTVLYCMAWYIKVQHDTARFGTFGTVGLEWNGIQWNGAAWQSMVYIVHWYPPNFLQSPLPISALPLTPKFKCQGKGREGAGCKREK